MDTEVSVDYLLKTIGVLYIKVNRLDEENQRLRAMLAKLETGNIVDQPAPAVAKPNRRRG